MQPDILVVGKEGIKREKSDDKDIYKKWGQRLFNFRKNLEGLVSDKDALRIFIVSFRLLVALTLQWDIIQPRLHPTQFPDYTLSSFTHERFQGLWPRQLPIDLWRYGSAYPCLCILPGLAYRGLFNQPWSWITNFWLHLFKCDRNDGEGIDTCKRCSDLKIICEMRSDKKHTSRGKPFTKETAVTLVQVVFTKGRMLKQT